MGIEAFRRRCNLKKRRRLTPSSDSIKQNFFSRIYLRAFQYIHVYTLCRRKYYCVRSIYCMITVVDCEKT